MTNISIEMLLPIAEGSRKDKGLSRRPDTLDNKVVGILENDWPCYQPFLARLQELLAQRYKVKEFVRKTKVRRDMAAPPGYVEELVAKCDVVINGIST